MKSWVALSVLAGFCAVVRLTHAQCDLSGRKNDLDFPDVDKEGLESYEMSVEYTLPGSTQTDYYTEYYDILDNKGRVDSNQAGKSRTYVYRTASMEAWEITSDSCTLGNITDTPEMFRDLQTEWLYIPKGKTDKFTVGPSAMFKIARDAWNSTDRKSKMAYMGASKENIRGIEAQYWQRCDTQTSWVKYYFTADNITNPFDLKNMKRMPLRVEFGGKRDGVSGEAQVQLYDIMTFQPFISLNTQPFQLPKGRGCQRADYLPDAPEMPDFSGKNLMFQAEVIYRTVTKQGDATQYWSYYSTLFLAIDIASNHIAYYYTPWSNTKEPSAEAPKHVVFDSKHGYMYKIDFGTGKCEINRQKAFIPEFKLPMDAGSIALTDPYILFPNNEFVYITEGKNRGHKVNIFEQNVENFQLRQGDEYDSAPKARISHSYLQDNDVEQNTVAIKNALTQIDLVMEGRKTDLIETLTFNFFDFTTELMDKWSIFGIMECFRLDEDYAWVTIGFNADKEKIDKVQKDVPSIQQNVYNEIMAKSELSPERVPFIQVNMEDGIFVSLLILGKPPLKLDYLDPIDGQTITGATRKEGVSDFNTCATKCLESEDNCWGFSMCGAICYFGTSDTQKPGRQNGCKLYNRYNKETYIPSKEQAVENIRRQVEVNRFSLLLTDKDDNRIQIDASSVEVTNEWEDDEIFHRIGNELNPRMRIVKVGYKLKAGTAVRNMGRIRYEECQRLCLDYKECETVSYCLTNSDCVISMAYGDELKDTDMVADNMCNLITRKYADNFQRSAGLVLSVTANAVLKLDTVEKCARACLNQTAFDCLSFDHCPVDAETPCKLHTMHFPSDKKREPIETRAVNCGHYYRKVSTEFKKNLEKRSVGSTILPLYNMTLEECAQSCKEYKKGTCTGFDFCQGATILSTSCTLLDSDPTIIKTAPSPICTNYLKKGTNEPVTASTGDPLTATVPTGDPGTTLDPLIVEEVQARPYTNGFAGGIGFLCFLVGALVGAGTIFGIAYYRMNRQR